MKNIRNFVVAASLLLSVWLGLTFVSKVPSHRYPTLGKDSKDRKISVALERPKDETINAPIAH